MILKMVKGWLIRIHIEISKVRNQMKTIYDLFDSKVLNDRES
jgi:hypothetical protein